ncbi:uncharacterized protein LOC132316686 [Cornus florida]|uniref:uncharacterized protein LOC132316686 n=1 Tax=Cornus florida TaxID=4283 RepID=UPI00289ABEC3|nr:uncharacterized protein LOC132316686 [Cornus florida]
MGFKYKDNSRKYYRVVCEVNGCPWKVTVGCESNSDTVRIIWFNNVHTYNARDISNYKPVFHLKEMGRIIVNMVRDNPSYKPNTICSDLESEFSINMTYKQAWRAKEGANQIIEGRSEDSYILVPWLCQRLSEAIPRIYTSWECTDDKRFKRVGTMLGATGYDANDGLWPLAYGIVSSENDDDWHWFLNLLKDILDGCSVTFLTDRHGGGKEGALKMLDNIVYARTEEDYNNALVDMTAFRVELSVDTL